jgi:hypothetical protein
LVQQSVEGVSTSIDTKAFSVERFN